MVELIVNIDDDSEFDARGGVAGYFSWESLESILRKTHALQDDESIKGYRVNENGVNFFIKRVDTK